MYHSVLKNAKNDLFFDFKTLKMVLFFIDLSTPYAFLSIIENFSLILFFKIFRNILNLTFEIIRIFESSNHYFNGDFGKDLFLWNQNGFIFFANHLCHQVVSSDFAGFFLRKFQCIKMTRFWPKFTIYWVSRQECSKCMGMSIHGGCE